MRMDADAHHAPTHGAACILNANVHRSQHAPCSTTNCAAIANTQDDGLEWVRHGSDLMHADTPPERSALACAARSHWSRIRWMTLTHLPCFAHPSHLRIFFIFCMLRLCERPRCTLLYRSTLCASSVSDFPILRIAHFTLPPSLYLSLRVDPRLLLILTSYLL